MENQKRIIPDEILEEVNGGANHSPAGIELPSSGQVALSLTIESNLSPDLQKLGDITPIDIRKDTPTDIRNDILIGKAYDSPWNMSTIEAEINNIGLTNP